MDDCRIPTVIVLLGITWLYLRYVAFRHDLKYLPGGQTLIKTKVRRAWQNEV